MFYASKAESDRPPSSLGRSHFDGHFEIGVHFVEFLRLPKRFADAHGEILLQEGIAVLLDPIEYLERGGVVGEQRAFVRSLPVERHWRRPRS